MDRKLESRRKICGRKGEEIAQQVLRARSYTIITTNFHSRYGEIDVIAAKNGIMHFCEVKTRISSTFGTPEEAVNWKKLQKIKKTIQCYQQQYGYTPWQIDLVAIRLSPTFQPQKITYYKNLSVT